MGAIRITIDNYTRYHAGYSILKPAISFNLILMILILPALTSTLVSQEKQIEFEHFFWSYRIKPGQYLTGKYIVFTILAITLLSISTGLQYVILQIISKYSLNLTSFLFMQGIQLLFSLVLMITSLYCSRKYGAFKGLLLCAALLAISWLIYLPFEGKEGFLSIAMGHLSISKHLQNSMEDLFKLEDWIYLLLVGTWFHFANMRSLREKQ